MMHELYLVDLWQMNMLHAQHNLYGLSASADASRSKVPAHLEVAFALP
jgi:hypothetical protein